ncbi:MAG: Na(+)-translocating NADH-quinone reductase subunit A [Daejeonella sp.]|uniref:Na(+)-translocating NADH-quinone reductase subunit A n=1 Tax=Daejeonella sp. TaxID=2805397 RepID=UPI003C743776
MSRYVKITRGLNIKLAGEATKSLSNHTQAETFAVCPADFHGLSPKLMVKEGDEVLAGSPILYDKNNESIKFSSPVSGEIIEIVRGDKRKILEVKILADRDIRYLDHGGIKSSGLSREAVIEHLLKSGTWPFIRQRPFGIVANPQIVPKSIFISAFDSNPLAPDIDFVLKGKESLFQAGLDVLQQLTDGKVHLNIHTELNSSSYDNYQNVQINKFSGPHPAGNVGVQIHHIDPLNKGEFIWTVNAQDVIVIGNLFEKGIYNARKIITVAGSQTLKPAYFQVLAGCNIKNLLKEVGLKDGDKRFISGSVLSGSRISSEGFLGFYDSQVTVIPEGNQAEFLGWLRPGLEKFSVSRAFFSWLNPSKKHELNTNLHGEERPFVVTGEYEKVFPMDIYPVQLLKSILIEDIEQMEKLGIYEVVEEDFALCEFVCTSKIKSQEIVRKGLNMIQSEFS